MLRSALSLDEVLGRNDIWRGDAIAHRNEAAESSGFTELDAELPGKGWSAGALTELLPAQAGVGELALLWPALTRLSRERPIALIAPPWLPFAPAWSELDLQHLWIVHSRDAKDALWASAQVFASGAFAAVLSWLPDADAADLRRLQLRLEGRRTLAFVMRPERVARSASPALLRLQLSAASGGKLAVHILKRRGPPLAAPLRLVVPRPACFKRLDHHALAGSVLSTSRARSFHA